MDDERRAVRLGTFWRGVISGWKTVGRLLRSFDVVVDNGRSVDAKKGRNVLDGKMMNVLAVMVAVVGVVDDDEIVVAVVVLQWQPSDAS